MKYENIPVIIKFAGDFKVLCFVNGNSKAEVIREMKKNSWARNQGIVYLDHPDFSKGFNSNRF